MSKINELNININTAVITSINLKLDKEDGLSADVHGALMTKTGKQVSEFYFSTNGWTDERKIELPMGLHNLARGIFEILTPEIYKKIEGEFKELSAGTKKKTEETKVDAGIDVDLEDIPF